MLDLFLLALALLAFRYQWTFSDGLPTFPHIQAQEKTKKR